MPFILFDKRRVHKVSFEGLEELGIPLGDGGQEVSESEGEQAVLAFMNMLTTRQKQVVELMASGYSRAEIAQKLQPPVVVQAVHQIVIRIRHRLIARGDVEAKGWRRRHGQY